MQNTPIRARGNLAAELSKWSQITAVVLTACGVPSQRSMRGTGFVPTVAGARLVDRGRDLFGARVYDLRSSRGCMLARLRVHRTGERAFEVKLFVGFLSLRAREATALMSDVIAFAADGGVHSVDVADVVGSRARGRFTGVARSAT